MGCVPDKNQIRFVYQKPKIANIHKEDINLTSEEDTEKNFISLFTAINALAEKYDMPILTIIFGLT